MRHREVLISLAGFSLLAIGTLLSRRGEISAREVIVDAGNCRLPVTILEPSGSRPSGFAVVLHGFSGNRRAMEPIGEQLASVGIRVFLPDLPGHGDNSQSFSFPRAESCAADFLAYLQNRSEIIPSRTILAGHSMGGAIAIRLGDGFGAAGTIALSPAPMSPMPNIPPQFLLYALPETVPKNLLVLRGGFEPPATAEADRKLVKLSQQQHIEEKLAKQPEPADMARRAEWSLIPFSSHVGILWDPRAFHRSMDWTRDSLRLGDQPPLKVHSPAVGGGLGVVGIFCLFPVVAVLLARFAQPVARYRELDQLPPMRALAHLVASSAVVVLILNFWIPLRFLRIVTGDYMGSFFLLVGIYLLFVFRDNWMGKLSVSASPLIVGAMLSLMLVVGLGAWLNWRLDDAWMNAGRWVRFVPLVIACIPFCAAEELILGPPAPQMRKRRFLWFAVFRLLEWVILVLAFLLFHNGQLLIVLLAVFIGLFSILQRLGMDVVRRRTGSRAATAIFGAILWSWFLAAVLPLN